MSADERDRHEEVLEAKRAVEEAAEVLTAASRRRVPNPDLAEARRKLRAAEERLAKVRAAVAKDATSVSLRPTEPAKPARKDAAPPE